MNGSVLFGIISDYGFHGISRFDPVNYEILRAVGLVNSIYGFKTGDL